MTDKILFQVIKREGGRLDIVTDCKTREMMFVALALNAGQQKIMKSIVEQVYNGKVTQEDLFNMVSDEGDNDEDEN